MKKVYHVMLMSGGILIGDVNNYLQTIRKHEVLLLRELKISRHVYGFDFKAVIPAFHRRSNQPKGASPSLFLS